MSTEAKDKKFAAKKMATDKPTARLEATPSATAATPRHYRTFVGEVVSTSMQKTIVVRVDTDKLNKKYNKKYSTSAKYHVHDEKNAALVGTTVMFVECRPLSKTKRWRLLEIKKLPNRRGAAPSESDQPSSS